MTTYDPSLTMRAARDRYFEDNGFGADGGYQDVWVDFKLGPIPMPFPNTEGRLRAVRYHDLNHVITGYTTDIGGELEIAAWEIGAGCKDFWVAWQLNLGGLAGGMAWMPRKTFRAFVRGRRSSTLYGRDYEALLDRTVGDLVAETRVDRPAKARPSDYALFALAWAAGTVAGLASFAAFFVVGPIAFVAWLLRGAPRHRAASAARA